MTQDRNLFPRLFQKSDESKCQPPGAYPTVSYFLLPSSLSLSLSLSLFLSLSLSLSLYLSLSIYVCLSLYFCLSFSLVFFLLTHSSPLPQIKLFRGRFHWQPPTKTLFKSHTPPPPPHTSQTHTHTHTSQTH